MTLSDKSGFIAPNGDEVLNIVYRRDGNTYVVSGISTMGWVTALLSQVERDSRVNELDIMLGKGPMSWGEAYAHIYERREALLQSLEPGRE